MFSFVDQYEINMLCLTLSPKGNFEYDSQKKRKVPRYPVTNHLTEAFDKGKGLRSKVFKSIYCFITEHVLLIVDV